MHNGRQASLLSLKTATRPPTNQLKSRHALVAPPTEGERFVRDNRIFTIRTEPPQLSIHEIKFDNTLEVPPHTHDHLDAMLVLDGEIELLGNEQPRRISPGTIIAVPLEYPRLPPPRTGPRTHPGAPRTRRWLRRPGPSHSTLGTHHAPRRFPSARRHARLLALTETARERVVADELQPILARHREVVQARYHDTEAHSARASDLLMLEFDTPGSHAKLIEKLRSSPIFTVPYFILEDLLVGEQAAWLERA